MFRQPPIPGPVLADYLHHPRDPERGNPHGYRWAARMDTAEGAYAYAAHVLALMRRTGASGLIVWKPEGMGNGVFLDPAVHRMPPGVEGNWRRFCATLAGEGKFTGFALRPGDVTVPAVGGGETTIRGGRGAWEYVWQQVQWALGLGVCCFYMDSFGNDMEDVALMRWLRGRGLSVPVFVENPCDLILRYAGAYADTRGGRWPMPWPELHALTGSQVIVRRYEGDWPAEMPGAVRLLMVSEVGEHEDTVSGG